MCMWNVASQTRVDCLPSSIVLGWALWRFGTQFCHLGVSVERSPAGEENHEPSGSRRYAKEGQQEGVWKRE